MLLSGTEKRILVIGCGGSGKTTLARSLASALGLPVIHLDRHYWKPGWRQPDKAEWGKTVDELLARPQWVMDGNYGGTLIRRVAVSDAVVFLDLPRHICLWRILRRRLAHRNSARPDMAPGCRERLDWPFIHWIWTYRKQRSGAVHGLLRNTPISVKVLILQSSKDVDNFLGTVL